jgi:hypothetical protein
VQVGFANEPAISVREDKDHGGGRQAADLQQNEHDVVAVQGERTDEQAAEEHIIQARLLTPAEQCSLLI